MILLLIKIIIKSETLNIIRSSIHFNYNQRTKLKALGISTMRKRAISHVAVHEKLIEINFLTDNRQQEDKKFNSHY